jgi:hypothetical protein
MAGEDSNRRAAIILLLAGLWALYIFRYSLKPIVISAFNFLFPKYAIKEKTPVEEYYEYVKARLRNDVRMQIYDLYRGNVGQEIAEYLHSVHAVDNFSVVLDDYIRVCGVETNDAKKYVFIWLADAKWDACMGYFHEMDSWPLFTILQERIKDVFEEGEKMRIDLMKKKKG